MNFPSLGYAGPGNQKTDPVDKYAGGMPTPLIDGNPVAYAPDFGPHFFQ